MEGNPNAYLTISKTMLVLVLYFVLKYIIHTVISSHVAPSLYGDYSLAVHFLALMAPFYILGSTSSLMKNLPKYVADDDHIRIGNYLRWNIKLIAKSLGISIGLIILMFLLIAGLHHFHIYNADKFHMAVYFQIAAPVVAVFLLLSNLLLVLRKYFLYTFTVKLLKYLIQLPLFIILFLIADRVEAYYAGIIFIIIFASLLMLLVDAYVIKKSNFNLLSYYKNQDNTAQDKSEESEWLRYSRVLLMNSSIFILVAFLDLLIVEVIPFHGEHNVGYYSACLFIMGSLWMPIFSIRTFLKPILAAKKDIKFEQQMVNKSNIYQLISMLLLTVLICYYSRTLLGFFGPQYEHYQSVLWVLTIGYAISLIPSLSFFYCLYFGHEKILLIQNYITLFGIVIFGSLGYYYFGLMGISYAVVVFRNLIAWALFIIVKTKTKFKYLLVF